MSSAPSIDNFRAAIRAWSWAELRRAMADFARYTDSELAAMREECERRSGSREPRTNRPTDVRCPRCDLALSYAGTKKFHEGTRWGILGDLGELFVNKEEFDVYFCPRCGKVEFFVDGVGEDLRPQ